MLFLIIFLSAATFIWGIPENKHELWGYIKSNKKRPEDSRFEQWILNYADFLACIVLASDWFKDNELLSQLTHAHYRDTVSLTCKWYCHKRVSSKHFKNRSFKILNERFSSPFTYFHKKFLSYPLIHPMLERGTLRAKPSGLWNCASGNHEQEMSGPSDMDGDWRLTQK